MSTEETDDGTQPSPDDDNFVPDFIKRAITTGFRTVEWGSGKVGAVGSSLNHVRQDVVAVVGREIVRYLDRLNLTEEAVKVLTAISLEVKTEIRFIPNDKKLVKPNVKSAIKVKGAPDLSGPADGAAEASDAATTEAKPKRRRPRRKKPVKKAEP